MKYFSTDGSERKRTQMATSVMNKLSLVFLYHVASLRVFAKDRKGVSDEGMF